MIEYREIVLEDVAELANMYVETFNAEPWNDQWTIETAGKRLHQMINVEDFYGLMAFDNEELCGMILGCKEQFYNGIMFSVREFCVTNKMRGQGIGTKLFKEFEARVKALGVTEIILFTSKGEMTEHFYHKRGLQSYDSLVVMGKHLE